jgi:hypothetical protein
MVVSCHHNAEKNHNLMLANKFFANVARFKHLRTTITVKRKLNSGSV